MTATKLNDFVIKLANVNGSGSASANGMLMKSIFRMGIPVTGKNFFPSNIQGLPTWYEIRISKDGYLCRSGKVDLMVAMNAETYNADLAEVESGGFLLYDSTWPRKDLVQRDDVTVLGIPLSGMCNEAFESARAKVLMKNVAYVGALVALLNIDMDVVKALLEETFSAKPHLMDSNMQAIRMGYDYAVEHFECPLPLQLEAMDKTAGHVLVDGNTTAGLGAVYAGATVVSWYPITPSTSLIDAFSIFCKQLRVDPDTGKNNYCVIQAEDELSAIGMVLGANWNGARAFTATSGPGVSLMSEFLGLAYYAEIPAVLYDVQRVSPSTGMPTRTQQCDIVSAAYASHGDTKHVLLFPADPLDCFHMSQTAFDLAEQLQTPVIVLTDLDIGMNDWMIPEIQWDENYVPNRGKVYDAEQLKDMDAFYRYLDVDGDAIPWRTLPGVDPKGAYFVRGSGHNKLGGYTEKSDEYKEVVDRLRRKFDTAATLVPSPIVTKTDTADKRWAILSIGSCDAAIQEARDRLTKNNTANLDYLRVRAFPFHADVLDFIDQYEQIFVVEQNRDAQLRQLLCTELELDPARLIPLLSYDGMPVSSDFIVDAVSQLIKQGMAA
ncbi:MAG: 2-oxoacid:acceptor oxidoreductase subunit alpha [Gammaproteobacteria bacterium]|nr:2-oxoacid:acceptor oxidoreductase subunit alpha [Gammaproteobacteria bacterium]